MSFSEIALLSSRGLQNIHAPLPLPMHIVFCLLATLLYIVQFARKNYNYYLYLILAVDLTILTQFFEQDYVILVLGIAEIILLVMAFVSSRKIKKAQKQDEERQKREQEMKKGEEARAEVTLKKISREEFLRNTAENDDLRQKDGENL